MIIIPLYKALFSESSKTILKNDDFEVTAFKYHSGIEGLKVQNSQGHLVILPYMGQMIWDAEFKGTNLCMENMFSEPKPKTTVVETYGCFAFHSGLIRNGCPSPVDDHPLHGEMPCAAMDQAWLEIDNDKLRIKGSYEYVMGFGDHYLATPGVTLKANSSLFDIYMKVENLASVPMPLQYMCHINSAYVADAVMTQNIPDDALCLRESVPSHVKPTESWLELCEKLKSSGETITRLASGNMYDPEIVFFMDKLEQYGSQLEFKMALPNQETLVTRFNTDEFNYATRWLLCNGDQKVAAYVLPATCRPEGYLAAKESGSLIMLEAGQSKSFTVTTGII